ncbi:MAG TPA: anthranilate synthase component I [Candidatus Limnocylindrales bacterium]|nr:anthranilate synthase component I [Candidatus Limnocylindrales bacterium]
MSLVPDLEGFRRLAAEANTIPVYREIAADLDTPVSAFLKLHRGGQGFLLESVEGGDRWGRYSILGSDPLMTLRAKDGVMTVSRRNGAVETIDGDPVDALRKVLAPFRPAHVPGLSRFAGGFVGYLSYDLVRTVERLPDGNVDDLGVADVAGLIADNFVLFDNVTHTMKVVSLAVLADHGSVDDAYASASYSVERTVERLRTSRVPLPTPSRHEPVTPVSNCTTKEYETSVERSLEYIAAGDIFQVVVSQRLEAPLATHPFSIYRALRTINPSPYLFYLDLGAEVAVGSSPEVMVRVENRRITVRPIAGTIRRGATPEEDEALVASMLADPKEQAEHIMLVDLGRNDVGRVAEIGSVSVDERMVIERYSHVHHIVSLVSGRLRDGMDCLDAFRATFPAGTLSGAPKVRAMQIIDEVEKTRRGLYGGAVGYVDFFGNLDTCIAIRTVLVKNEKTYVQVGAGIVADSVPEREQTECGEKCGAMMAALAHAAEIERS